MIIIMILIIIIIKQTRQQDKGKRENLTAEYFIYKVIGEYLQPTN